MVTLADLLRAKLGVETYTRTNRLVSSIGEDATRVLPNDPNRVAAIIVNLSAADMHFGPFPDVKIVAPNLKGVLVPAGGGNMILIWDEDLSMVGEEWYGVAAAAGSALLTMELVTMPEKREE